MKEAIAELLDGEVPPYTCDLVIKVAGIEALISSPIRRWFYSDPERRADLLTELAFIVWTIHYLELPEDSARKWARKRFRQFCKEEGLIDQRIGERKSRAWKCPSIYPVPMDIEDPSQWEDEIVARLDYESMVGYDHASLRFPRVRELVRKWRER